MRTRWLISLVVLALIGAGLWVYPGPAAPATKLTFGMPTTPPNMIHR